ncbi:glycosyltransferase [Spongisporangium articulatum]|uniref:Glycosyltransferase n=1 Tax=Spongisporangium articulatum TaxID=3362603 RepID=A0ABW8AKB3_9ACTN
MAVRVSVVVACLDAEATLGVQLEALARQTFRGPFEVLICDNGSRDGSRELACSYVDRLPGLRVLDASDRRGPGHARNVGARAAQAPLVVFCDADDEVADDWLATMVAALHRNPFVAGRFGTTRLNGAWVRRTRPLDQQGGLQHSPFGPDLPHAGAGNLGIRRELFLQVGGFDAVVGCLEDTDLCWRVQLTGVTLTYCPEAVVHVRLRRSLRAMWWQGRSYGAAAALLEHRYAVLSPRPSPVEPGRPGASSPALKLFRLVAARRSPGALAWTLAWHVGHRAYVPDAADRLPQDARGTLRAG